MKALLMLVLYSGTPFGCKIYASEIFLPLAFADTNASIVEDIELEGIKHLN